MSAQGELARETARDAVHTARTLGAEEAEAYASVDHTWSARARRETVTRIRHSDSCGVGLRVVSGGAIGYAYTSLAQPGAPSLTLRSLAEQALGTATVTRPVTSTVGGSVLPAPDGAVTPVPGLHSPELARWDPRRATATVATINEAARSVAGVADVPRIHYGLEHAVTAVANSHGVDACSEGALHYAWAEVLCTGDGRTQAGSDATWSRELVELPAGEVGLHAARAALASRGARAAPTGTFPVVIAPAAAVNLLDRMELMLSGELVRKGRSLIAGEGERLGSQVLTVIDDPRLPGGLASRPFDAEGLPSRTRRLIDRGVVTGVLYDSRSAADAGAAETANAVRSSYRALPRPGSSNLFIQPGETSRVELERSLGDGLVVEEILGLHGTNPASGRFSVSVRGYWVEGGQRAWPVTDTALAGSYRRLWSGIQDVGSDLEFRPGRGGCGSPSLLVDALAVSGTAGREGSR
ncbi:TldD/PmbA family protein [Haloechinothrix sp. LS1_15]|uniref:TldD/PmbA family protein n=1 Tax=Haloechinothrix sp. LS1_15 TaxID=2652248 RepID=UPI00294677BD|nr:TldD/PmbA family protein [Haloechinothrix sp. LS1_15]MDV6011962.1 TldD/PmbA family protein [Haloechinothrix sp. LS1_15]